VLRRSEGGVFHTNRSMKAIRKERISLAAEVADSCVGEGLFESALRSPLTITYL
jgi:hypothetical protein